MVEGSLKYDAWEKDGQKHSRLLVRANRVQFLGGRPQGDGDAAASGEGRYQAAPAGRTPERAAEVPEPPPPPPAPDGQDMGDDENLPF